MNYSFISLVSLVVPEEETIKKFLKNTHALLKENFSDYEIILVNNRTFRDIRPITRELDDDIRKDISVINLSREVTVDNALVAGLDRANGDYTVILDMNFADNPSMVLDLYTKSQNNNDIVYVKFKKRKLSLLKRFLFNLYFVVLRKLSDLHVDINMDKSRIISRRALNSILKVRENLSYMKGVFAYVGYNTDFIQVEAPQRERLGSVSKQLNFALKALISYTDVLSKLFQWIFILSLLFSMVTCLDAVFIKVLGFDIFGTTQNNVIPGWSILIVTISMMFTLISLMLYLLSMYMSSLNNEVRNRPIYIIESIQRI
jgi:ABC-type multidrug transport system fused ATPase/permease subunit